jgi:putative transposase
MPYNPQIHHRQSIRLKGYDYSKTGLYFITICCQDRAYLFGEIVGAPVGGAQMILNDAGKMIETQWLALKERFPNIELHEFIVMPNHFHGILEIVKTDVPLNAVGATLVVAQNEEGQPRGLPQRGITPTVGDMMDAFKSITTVEYIRGVKGLGWQRFNGKVWQRNYWEHIIRNEEAYQRIANYIVNNPQKWGEDKLK